MSKYLSSLVMGDGRGCVRGECSDNRGGFEHPLWAHPSQEKSRVDGVFIEPFRAGGRGVGFAPKVASKIFFFLETHKKAIVPSDSL